MLFLSVVLYTANLFSQELSVIELANTIRRIEIQGNAAARSIISQYWQLSLFQN
jgi:hypothetical protein